MVSDQPSSPSLEDFEDQLNSYQSEVKALVVKIEEQDHVKSRLAGQIELTYLLTDYSVKLKSNCLNAINALENIEHEVQELKLKIGPSTPGSGSNSPQQIKSKKVREDLDDISIFYVNEFSVLQEKFQQEEANFEKRMAELAPSEQQEVTTRPG